MIAGQITEPRRIDLVEMPLPQPGDGEILVKVEVGSICGSDLPYFLVDRAHPSIADLPVPLPPALSLHELIGTVAQTRSRRFREGDRVLALPYKHRGLSEYFLSHQENAVPIPKGPGERLVLSQPLGTVIHACLKLPNLLGQTAVILGQGPIGQLFSALLSRMGALRIIAVDPIPERLGVARRMGATHTIGEDAAKATEMVHELTGGRGADLVVEAVGHAEAFKAAMRLARRNGTVIAFGLPHRAQYVVEINEFFYNEGRLINSVGPDVQRDFPIAVEMIAAGLIDVSPLVTHRFHWSHAQDAFAIFADRRDGAIKVILNFDGNAPGCDETIEA
jgi:threonine dehydrogenase-like Zn-dependent dehydrogenase